MVPLDPKDPEQSIPLLEKFVISGNDDEDDEEVKEEDSREEEDMEAV